MNIVITTPTGNIGSVVTRALLAAGERPTLIARYPEKLSAAVQAGATVIRGDHSDATVLTAACLGAEALFLCVPTDVQVTDINGTYRRYAEAAAKAARTNGIARVVVVSSAGADLATGNGPVSGLHLLEQILGNAGIPHLTILRPGYFMENTLAQLASIRLSGKLFTTFATGARFPMIATRDIGVRAAAILTEVTPPDTTVVELHGGRDISYDDVASILSEVLDRRLEHVTISAQQYVAGAVAAGMSRQLADALVELADAIATGRVGHRRPRTADSTTPTDYATFARDVVRPTFAAMAAD